MIRTQISFDAALYKRARQAAKLQGVSLAELCRRSLAQVIAQSKSTQPWMAFVGAVDGAADDSSRVDDVVYGRDAP
jgi:hypothetical protein